MNSGPGKSRILVVDDDPSILRCVENIASRLGCGILLANSGKKALQALQSTGDDIAILLTDVMMPGMTGPQVANSIKQIQPQTKVVFMTGSGNVEAITKEYTDLHGDLDYLTKPFTPDELINTLKGFLR